LSGDIMLFPLAFGPSV